MEEDKALDEKLRSEALQPNSFGRLAPEPPPPPPPYVTKGFNGQRGMDYTGRLAPEYEGDTRERYSNPYARRLGEVSKQRPDLLKPGTPEFNLRRDGYLSVKPANLACDEGGRNCKFSGAAKGVKPPRGYIETVPYEDTADYRRAQLAEQNRLIRERNLAKQAELDAAKAVTKAEKQAALMARASRTP